MVLTKHKGIFQNRCWILRDIVITPVPNCKKYYIYLEEV